MALTSVERTSIRTYLGYANLHRYLNTRLESAFDAVDTDAETAVRAMLTELTAVDLVLATAGQTVATQGGLKAITGDVEWYEMASGASNGSGALTRGRMLIARLSTILGVPLYGDYYGASGYPGDTFSEFGLLGDQGVGKRGGIIPIG